MERNRLKYRAFSRGNSVMEFAILLALISSIAFAAVQSSGWSLSTKMCSLALSLDPEPISGDHPPSGGSVTTKPPECN
jgi:hypothetical protein